ncbi:tyrosine-type recombinase/integrase [Anaeromyxobacter sp. PSR-1]|uniref:tyrosine-type recombinase/integrase n=1 Tax=Anaeromyxobacter sp. PSR-1 TaxID=1300915 RepID=UPI0005DFC598|nr:tyrosine-type recombinase/integrase [Anaeromyxobacter sp. PSR-1]GAO01940.1 tyrosine recombinase XerC [Anaeromyxobacter sp. PSR-1]
MAYKKWLGGRYWEAPGIKVFHIYKMRNGKRYSVSTKCSTEKAALKEYERWEQDPDNYRPLGGEDGVTLDQDLIDSYVETLRAGGRSEGRIGRCRSYLKWWAERLPSDISKANLKDFNLALKEAPNRGMRVNVVSAFWTWLVKSGLVEKDPTKSLVRPPGKPAQLTRPKVISDDRHQKVMKHLSEEYRDLMVFLEATGWHVSELERFAQDDGGNLTYPRRNGKDIYVAEVIHKSGRVHRTELTEEAEEVAVRIRGRGPFNRVMFYRAVKKACEDAKVKPFTPGMYRATLATKAVEAGEDPKAVSAFLGHSYNTMMKFYATRAVVPRPRMK